MLRLLSILPVIIACASYAQQYKFDHYSEQDGLSSQYVYTIAQDQRGYLLVGTSEGLFRFDGFRFDAFTRNDSLSDNLIETSATLHSGEILFGHNNGNLTIYDHGQLELLDLRNYFKSRITSICEDKSSGACWIASQNSGLVRWMRGTTPTHFFTGLEDYNVLSMYALDGALWIGTDMGLLHAVPQSDGSLSTQLLDGFPVTNTTCINGFTNGRFLVATEDAGLFVMQGNRNQTPEPISATGIDLSTVFIKEVRADESGQIWLSTNANGLIRLSEQQNGVFQRVTHYNEGGIHELFSIRTSYQDREGNLWIGTIGNGLVRLVDDYFTTYLFPTEADHNIFSVAETSDSLWIGGIGAIHRTSSNPSDILYSYTTTDGLPASRILTIHMDGLGNLWAGSEEHGLFLKKKGEKKFRSVFLSEDKLNQSINDLISTDRYVYVATDYGAFVLNGDVVTEHLTIENGLSGNVVRCFFKDRNARIWIGTTTSGLNYIENDQVISIPPPIANTSLPIRCFAEDQQGNIWAGTEGFGLMKIGENVTIYQKPNGLYSDFCYSLICDDKNRIWVGHRGAISRLDLESGAITILSPGEAGEVYFEDNAVMRQAGGILLFGTNHGLLRYDPEQDKLNTLEPLLSITGIEVSDSTYAITDQLELPNGDYKIIIGFVGISLKNPHGVSYQYMLEGYDNEWSKPTHNSVAEFNHLPPGHYVFKVKAFNQDGVGGSVIKEIRIYIEYPFWQQWWFIISSAILVFLIIRYIIIRRERFLKENQEYLKRELAERTKEVVEQKELLEIKNKDITDSIVYAKNIQKAMLPPHDTLNKHFADAFVYYKPRDIVSGDFYWIEQVGNKVFVACADCTGHGVPGAFMSLIGSILLKEITSDQHMPTPAACLSALHRDLFNLFKWELNEQTLADGMDISIMEYDTSTHLVRIASANRPVIIYQNDSLIEVKGDRKAIGGQKDVFVEEQFNLFEFQLSSGDQIYMFSDGVTDQFGGPRGKKLKRTGLKEIIAEIRGLDMAQQRQVFKDRFQTWKGDLAQLDDVIMMGMKI